jgi:hypothetical protein
MSEHGVEDVTPLHIPDDVNTTANTIASTITTTQSTTKALEHTSLPKYNDGDDSDNSSSESKNDFICIDVDSIQTDGHDFQKSTSVASLSATVTNRKIVDSTSFTSPGVCNTVFQEILKGRKIDAFGALDDVDPLIEDYEQKSGNQLSIMRGECDFFRLYVCKEHIDCTFQIFVGRR